MSTINVKDADGATVAIEKPLAPGRSAASASRPVALSTEDKTSLDAVSTTLNTVNTFLSSILTTVAGLLDVGTFNARTGALTETAPASDTASAGLNGRLQRIAQRLTSMIGQLPAALTAAGNLKVAILEGVAALSVSTEGTRASYSATAIEVAMTAAGVGFQIQGSGTKTVRITRLVISGLLTTATSFEVRLYRTTSTSSGTANTAPAAKHDSNNPSATATVVSIATPTGLGTGAVAIACENGVFGSQTVAGVPVKFDFGIRNAQPLALRGTSEFLGVFIGVVGGSFTGAGFNFKVELTEE